MLDASVFVGLLAVSEVECTVLGGPWASSAVIVECFADDLSVFGMAILWVSTASN